MLTLIIFLIILGSIVFFHELGHFIFAKKAGIYVYEFSLGFGPKLFSFKRKNDETEYMIKAIPLGGYVAMAGEEDLEEDDKLKIPDDKKLYNKSWIQRLLVMIAGVMNNFILGFILLFIIGLCNGSVFNVRRRFCGKWRRCFDARHDDRPDCGFLFLHDSPGKQAQEGS